MKRWMCTFSAIMVTAALTCCNFAGKTSGTPGEGGSLKKLGKDEKATIKVMYYDKNSFYQQYGNLFMAKNPNIDVEVVSNQGIYGPGKDPEQALEKLIDEEKPDVILVNGSEQLEKFVQKGRLYALDDVKIQAVMDGKKSADDALKTIQEKGQEALLKAKQEDDARKAAEQK